MRKVLALFVAAVAATLENNWSSLDATLRTQFVNAGNALVDAQETGSQTQAQIDAVIDAGNALGISGLTLDVSSIKPEFHVQSAPVDEDLDEDFDIDDFKAMVAGDTGELKLEDTDNRARAVRVEDAAGGTRVLMLPTTMFSDEAARMSFIESLVNAMRDQQFSRADLGKLKKNIGKQFMAKKIPAPIDRTLVINHVDEQREADYSNSLIDPADIFGQIVGPDTIFRAFRLRYTIKGTGKTGRMVHVVPCDKTTRQPLDPEKFPLPTVHASLTGLEYPQPGFYSSWMNGTEQAIAYFHVAGITVGGKAAPRALTRDDVEADLLAAEKAEAEARVAAATAKATAAQNAAKLALQGQQ